VEISQDEFFELLPNANPLPKTSQPSPADFEEVFRPILDAGDEIIAITLSSKLSGTYNSAHNAAMTLEGAPISVVDSMSASAGIALIVLAAARMVEAGRSREEIVSRLEAMAQQVFLVLTLDTLEYLKRGGRIGGAAAFLGGLLRVKPLIMLKDGVIEAAGRARSRPKAIQQIIEMESGRFGDRPVWVAVAQAQASDVGELEALAKEQLNVTELLRANVGPVVAAHTGPGVLGIAAVSEPEI
jgi:DegV family protein with EDD domain